MRHAVLRCVTDLGTVRSELGSFKGMWRRRQGGGHFSAVRTKGRRLMCRIRRVRGLLNYRSGGGSGMQRKPEVAPPAADRHTRPAYAQNGENLLLNGPISADSRLAAQSAMATTGTSLRSCPELLQRAVLVFVHELERPFLGPGRAPQQLSFWGGLGNAAPRHDPHHPPGRDLQNGLIYGSKI